MSCIATDSRELYTEWVGSEDRRIPIWISYEFGSADVIAISSAIDHWNRSLNGSIRLEVVDIVFNEEGEKVVEQIRERGWIIRKIGTEGLPNVGVGYNCVGFADKIGGSHIYIVRERLDNDEVFGVVMHEIGHLLGAGHVGHGLMQAHFRKVDSQCIDYDSAMAVKQYLKLGKINWCRD